MRIELRNLGEFDNAMDRLIRRVKDAEGDALVDASDRVGEAFRSTARRLSGAHADSYRSEPPRVAGDRTTVRGGPTKIYSRKISLRFGDMEAAVRDAGPRAVQDGIVRHYSRVVR